MFTDVVQDKTVDTGISSDNHMRQASVCWPSTVSHVSFTCVQVHGLRQSSFASDLAEPLVMVDDYGKKNVNLRVRRATRT